MSQPSHTTLSFWLGFPLLCLRICAVIMWTLAGLTSQCLVFTWSTSARKRKITRFWARGMLRCLGVSLQIHDSSPNLSQNASHNAGQNAGQNSTVLLVSNHVSWLDILVLFAVAPVVYVAKSDIRHWPVLGWMVALADTCFIDRDRRHALRSVHSALTAHLQAGQSIAIFPEGTTSEGSALLPFHAGLFEAAIKAQVPVLPVCLRYSHVQAAYVGEQTLINSALSILTCTNLQALAVVLPCLDTQGQDRASLSAKAHALIAEQLARSIH